MAGRPAIFIPLPNAIDDHQRANAQFLAAHGAALHLPQADCTAQSLAQVLRGLTRARLLAMAQNARALGRPEATARVVREIEALAQGPARPRAQTV